MVGGTLRAYTVSSKNLTTSPDISMKLLPVQFVMSAALLVSACAFAQTPAPAAAEAAAQPLSFNITLASNYKFRGQDQDQGKSRAIKPALQGGFDYAFDNGFYVGNWNSTVNWTKFALSTKDSAAIEVDLYGGYKFKAGPLDMDVGALTYLYPSASLANTTEVYLGAGYGPVSAKYAYTVSKGYFGLGKDTLLGQGKGTGYLTVGVAQEIAPKLTFKASLGMTNFKNAANAAGVPDYMDYSVGASYDLGNNLALSGAYVGADKKSNYLFAVDPSKSVNKGTVVVMLTKAL
jgi:uncharacterized protein (TIGR02001 family)